MLKHTQESSWDTHLVYSIKCAHSFYDELIKKSKIECSKLTNNQGDFMYYIVETNKSFNQAAKDLELAVIRNGFGVLHVHDLATTLRAKGITFNEECKVFEVCNPVQAAKVLSIDMRLNMALPCRISVFTESGKTKIGLIKPEQMLSALSDDEALARVAKEVEASIILMVDEAK